MFAVIKKRAHAGSLLNLEIQPFLEKQNKRPKAVLQFKTTKATQSFSRVVAFFLSVLQKLNKILLEENSGA